MSENGRARMLIERASSLGLEVSFDDSGFLMVSHSAGTPPRRDDAAEMEQAVIESLGGCLADVRDIAVAQSCSAQGRNFVGCRAYVPSEDLVGTIADSSPDGITVTYSRPTNEEDVRDRTSNTTVPGWRLFVIVSADELPAQIPSSAYASISSDRLRGMFERAESMGLRLEHAAGLILVRFPPTGTAETTDAIEATVRALGRSIREVRDFVIAQSRGVRGATFIGRKVFVSEFGAFGVLTSCHNDGSVGVTYERDIGVVTCLCGGDRLLVLDFEETAQAASPDQKSEATWKRLVRRAFGS
jgi:hypothetical protein